MEHLDQQQPLQPSLAAAAAANAAAAAGLAATRLRTNNNHKQQQQQQQQQRRSVPTGDTMRNVHAAAEGLAAISGSGAGSSTSRSREILRNTLNPLLSEVSQTVHRTVKVFMVFLTAADPTSLSADEWTKFVFFFFFQFLGTSSLGLRSSGEVLSGNRRLVRSRTHTQVIN